MGKAGTPTSDERLARTIRSYEDGVDVFTKRTADRSRITEWAAQFGDWVGDGGIVADVGCGPGHDCELLSRMGLRVVGLDLTHGMLRRAASDRPGHYACADMRRLPLRDDSVQGLFANASMLHIALADVNATLMEFRRVLAPCGTLFLTLKCGDGETLVKNPYPGMSDRWFTYWQDEPLNEALGTAGFEILESRRTPSNRPDNPDWLMRLCRS